MRYIFIAQTISQGGAERVISVLSTALSEQGADVTIIKYFDTDDEYTIGEKVRVINLSGRNLTEYKKTSKLKLVYKLRRIILTIKPDCILPFTLPVAQMTAIASIGVCGNVFQSIRINPAIMPVEYTRRIIRDWLVYHSRCTFVQNSQQKEYFNSKVYSRIHVLNNPVSEELFSVSPKTKNEEYVVSALGRLTNQKNYTLMIDSFADAFKSISSAKLRIYGEGVKRDELQAHIDELGMHSRIKLMGRTNDIKAVFQSSDLYVLSSDWEGMPNALIEAMACHVFCISTDCPTGPFDLIQNGKNGILVPVGDRSALAEAMRTAFSLPYNKRIAMSERARETVKAKCSSHSIAIELNRICESVVKSGDR